MYARAPAMLKYMSQSCLTCFGVLYLITSVDVVSHAVATNRGFVRVVPRRVQRAPCTLELGKVKRDKPAHVVPT